MLSWPWEPDISAKTQKSSVERYAEGVISCGGGTSPGASAASSSSVAALQLRLRTTCSISLMVVRFVGRFSACRNCSKVKSRVRISLTSFLLISSSRV